MTKQEMYELLGSLAFGVILYLLSRDITFAVCLPLGAFVFWSLGRRAFGASWLVRMNTEEAYFRKPLSLRAFNAALALALAGFIAVWVHLCMTSSHREPLGVGIFGLMFFALAALLFIWNAGPSETRFDLRRGQVQSRMGFPLLSRSRTWDAADIAALRVLTSSRAVSMSIFLRKRHGLTAGTSVSYRTGLEGWNGSAGAQTANEEARAVAEVIGKEMGLAVETRQVDNRRTSR